MKINNISNPQKIIEIPKAVFLYERVGFFFFLVYVAKGIKTKYNIFGAHLIFFGIYEYFFHSKINRWK